MFVYYIDLIILRYHDPSFTFLLLLSFQLLHLLLLQLPLLPQTWNMFKNLNSNFFMTPPLKKMCNSIILKLWCTDHRGRLDYLPLPQPRYIFSTASKKFINPTPWGAIYYSFDLNCLSDEALGWNVEGKFIFHTRHCQKVRWYLMDQNRWNQLKFFCSQLKFNLEIFFIYLYCYIKFII